MKLTLLLIPLLFFMTSCTIDWNDEKDAKIAELEKQLEQKIFEKKKECNNFSTNTKNLEYREIFYSESGNGCYVAYIKNTETGSGKSYIIADLFSISMFKGIEIGEDGKVTNIKGFDDSGLDIGSSTEEAKCKFNESIKSLKGRNYPNDADYFNQIKCK